MENIKKPVDREMLLPAGPTNTCMASANGG